MCRSSELRPHHSDRVTDCDRISSTFAVNGVVLQDCSISRLLCNFATENVPWKALYGSADEAELLQGD